jgi:hypothetical protein
MTKKIDRFEDWITANDAAQLLSEKLARPINPEYIRKLAKRKKNPVRTQPSSNRLLYSRDDILACEVKQKSIL